ncbi:MAG: glycosyltransferase [Crocosphaera sp.]|nr:glycosyltransferase [Crocosphaera sp.]MDJ0685778.1 glycosyltransferase [Alphaproteobacteria bacterium]
MSIFVADRYGAAHILKPVLESNPKAFLTNGDDEAAQRLWAKENGIQEGQSLESILLAQIEEHRTEVFYNLDPMRYGSGFIRRLPGCVKRSFAWRAAPSPGADFGAYDLVLCNFPSILKSYQDNGWRAAYFSPAHDDAMDVFAARCDRPVDVVFVGSYSRHHSQRAGLLEAVAGLANECEMRFHLISSRTTRLAESPVGVFPPLRRHRRPASIRAIAKEPVFGLDLYEALGSAKIVLNGAIDMAGNDRGNMRCFEAMGCGALMMSDAGHYPAGMIDRQNMVSYTSPADAVQHIRALLKDEKTRSQIALNAHHLMKTAYSKSDQWAAFVKLVEKT